MTERIRGRALLQLRLHVLAYYGPTCHLCGKTIDTTLRNPHRMAYVIDHVVPLSKNGTNALDNLRPSHRFCNGSKNNRTPNLPKPSRNWGTDPSEGVGLSTPQPSGHPAVSVSPPDEKSGEGCPPGVVLLHEVFDDDDW